MTRPASIPWSRVIVWLAVIAGMAVLPAFLNQYLLNMLIMVFFWTMLTTSLNLIGTMGYTCICLASFYGVGGYVSALMTLHLEAPFFLSLAAGAASAGIVGTLVGFPVFRVRGHYFAIATLSFALIISLVFSNWHAVTNGDRGLTGIFSPFLETSSYYYLVLAFVLLTILVTHLALHSRLGRQFTAIKEDEDLAQQMGIHTMRVKLTGFGLASVLAGLAGGLMVHYVNFVHPDFFTFAYSFNIIMGMLMGGVGSTGGAVLGGLIAVGLPEVLRFTAGWRYIVLGFILILVMLLMPKGIVGAIAQAVGERKRADK